MNSHLMLNAEHVQAGSEVTTRVKLGVSVKENMFMCGRFFFSFVSVVNKVNRVREQLRPFEYSMNA